MFRRPVEKYNKNHEEALPAITTHIPCDIHSAPTDQCGNEFESLTVFYGTEQYYHDLKLLRICYFWQRTGEIFQTGSLKEKRGFTTSLLPFKAKIQADLRKYVSIFHT